MSLQVGLSNRPAGNREYLWLPVWVYFQVTPSVAPFVGTGFGGAVEGFFSHMEMPLEGGCIVSASQNVDVGGMLQLTGELTSPVTLIGAAAVLLASINIVGGFLVTLRMLRMFHR